MYTSPEAIASLTSELINIRSYSGEEHEVCKQMVKIFERLGWKSETFPVKDGRENVMVTFGEPRIVFTTHLDVVPAPDHLFHARIESGVLYGRGACDAKGIAATMIGAALKLRESGADNFALLFVVGEEYDGCGAAQAAIDLAGRGIKFIVNGEPTQGKLVRAHKGAVDFELRFNGSACHSGYPELGVDANLKMIEAINRIQALDLGSDEVLGKATINFGVINGGVAGNIVSPSASMRALVRTVTPAAFVIDRISTAVADLGTATPTYAVDPTRMIILPGFETDVASYVTDIPNFAPLNAQAILYGPGTIFDAHTDLEKITLAEIADACAGYVRIWNLLQESR